MEKVVFEGRLELPDGSNLITELILEISNSIISGIENSKLGYKQLIAFITNEGGVIGLYGDGETGDFGGFLLNKTDRGYEGVYVNKNVDGSEFEGSYKWLRKG